MKTTCKHLATILLAALLGGCIPALAAVPLRWTVETSRAAQQRIDVYRGETVKVSVDLTSYGQPLALAGSAALYVQTPGMESAWWTVPATVSGSRIEATLAPGDYPADATLLNCFLGGPAINYRAAFTARILGAPGTAPNTVQPPVAILDFAALTVVNSPYCTRTEVEGLLPDLSGFAKKSDLNYLETQGISLWNSSDAEVYLYLSDDGTRLVFNRGGGAAEVKIPLDDMLNGTVALASDIPDTDEFVKNMGGSATNLAVYAKPGREDEEPALSVHGYVDASHGFVSGLDGDGGFLYVQDSAVSARLCYDSDSDNLAWDDGKGLFPAKLNGYVQKSVTIVERMNQSVQKVNVTSAGSVRVNLPKPKEGTVGDMVLYVFNGSTDEVSLSIDSLTSFYAEDDSVKDPLGPGVTALYFTEISHGVWAVGRKSLNLITVE